MILNICFLITHASKRAGAAGHLMFLASAQWNCKCVAGSKEFVHPHFINPMWLFACKGTLLLVAGSIVCTSIVCTER